jgi:hypothetical protein
VPTARNIPGQKSIPSKRYPDEAAPDMSQFRSATLLQYAPDAPQRNREHAQKLASGEIGKFYLKTSRESVPKNTVSDSYVSPKLSTQSSNIERARTARNEVPHASFEHAPGVQLKTSEPLTARSNMKRMLNDIDTTFPRRAKADLRAACSQEHMHSVEYKNVAISNQKEYEASAGWLQSLRRPKTQK